MNRRLLSLIICTIFLIPVFPVVAQRQMEYLDRGLVAIKNSEGVYLSWRVLGNEKDASYNVYRNGKFFKAVSATEATNIIDPLGKLIDKYAVKAVIDGVELDDNSQAILPWRESYKTLQLNRPAPGITPPNYYTSGQGTYNYLPNGEPYSYFPCESGVGDLDGDGELDLVIMWRPTNARDNAHTGLTGNVYLDGYKLDGTFLWRIDLGINIRAGSHYTQLLVYDFDGDGKAEVVCKTAPGTIDGAGNYVVLGDDDPLADYRGKAPNSRCGYILDGPEYLTIFDGLTGEELHTVPYEVPRGNIADWGDSYGNRVDRFLACVAYLDGVHPSAVMCRGYYERTTLAAYDFIDGKLELRWIHDSKTPGQGAFGQGNHNLSVADVDGDGKDEIIYGSCAFNADGTIRYTTGLGHGDAMHVSTMDPDLPGKFQVWQVTEGQSVAYDCALIDADTGDILWGLGYGNDNGRGLAADIDPNHPGFELWSASVPGTYNVKGEMISPNKPPISFRFYWDGDLQDEVLDGNKWYKWNGENVGGFSKFDGAAAYGSKKVHVMMCDLLGDWREEVVMFEENDSSKIRIYTTTIPTEHRLYTLMHDPTYRLAVAWQNVAYNQPPHLGFYIGGGVENIPWPVFYTPRYEEPSGTGDMMFDAQDIRATLYQNQLSIRSVDNLQLVEIYSVSGVLLHSIHLHNQTTSDITLTPSASQVLIVKVVSDTGSKVFKLSNY